MQNEYYTSLLWSIFKQWGTDLIFDFILLLPYPSILNLGITCKFMNVLCNRAAIKKEALIKQKAVYNIRENLKNEGYLEKIEELSTIYPLVLAGDAILAEVTTRPFSANYIDVYIGNDTPYDERSVIGYLTNFFTTTNGFWSKFVVVKQSTKFGYTTLYIALKNPAMYAKKLCLHLNCGPAISKFIETKFDLTCSMIWFDLHQIYTNRFWQQVCGIGYLNNGYFLDETAPRLIRFINSYRFYIANSDEFDWEFYNYEEILGNTSYDVEDASYDYYEEENPFYDTSNDD